MYNILDLTNKLFKTLTKQVFAKQQLYRLKMQKGPDLQQHVNTFNKIIIDLVKLGVTVDDEDKAIILLSSLLGSFENLVTTLTYKKDFIKLHDITAILQSHSQRRQNAEEASLGEGLYVKEGEDHGRNKGKAGYEKKKYKSKNRKSMECFS